jgi:UDP-glucose 4-epimerase
MAKKILITGGTGYLGGRIAAFLSRHAGNEITVTSRNDNFKPAGLQKAKLLKLNLQDDASVNDVCKGMDIVIHLAALNEIESAQNPQKALLVNGLGTLKLLEDAERNKVQKFIYLSTAHVYKAPLTGIITEDTLPFPVHPYAVTHRVAEDFVLASNQNKKLQAVVVRLSNGYGYPLNPEVNRWTLLINDLCKQAVTEKKLVLKSTGLQSRDFVTLTDVANAMEHFCNLPQDQTGNGIFNLGGENPKRIIEVTRLIAERTAHLFGYTPPLSHPAANGEGLPEMIDFRIDKLKATGFRLTGDMNEEIDKTLLLCNQSFNLNNA